MKQAALEEAPFAAEEAWVDEVAQHQTAPLETEAVSDPTIANAGLTEIDAGEKPVTEAAAEPSDVPAASNVGTDTANAAAQAQWEKQQSATDDPLTESFEMVPRDLAETETPHAAAAAPTSTQSWADEAHEQSSAPAGPAAANDGFSEVHHGRGGRGRGGHPGGDRGGYRGRGRGGPRGEFRGGRGRGRGDFRGGRGGFRGAPRGESS